MNRLGYSSVMALSSHYISPDHSIVPGELRQILKAANAAPVGMELFDRLHLTITTSKALHSLLESPTAAVFGKPEMHPLYGAPLLIFVFSRNPASMRYILYMLLQIKISRQAISSDQTNVVLHIP